LLGGKMLLMTLVSGDVVTVTVSPSAYTGWTIGNWLTGLGFRVRSR